MLPIRDNIPSRRWPVFTVLFIVANIAIYVRQFTLPEMQELELIYDWGTVPAWVTGRFEGAVPVGDSEYVAVPGTVPPVLTLLTATFLHGSWMHVLGNMLFLWIFGDNVEDRLGRIGFVLFYLVAGAFASLIHVGFNPDSVIPTVGASGAVAGVMGAYMVLYPKAKVMAWFPPVFLFPVPALIFLLIWIGSEFFRGMTELQGISQSMIATWAHIGGFVAGVMAGVILRTFNSADRHNYEATARF